MPDKGGILRNRLRVATYVLDPTRQAGTGRVLCFDHVDFPEAGTQIPAGGIAEGETVEAAAAREVFEETGVRVSRPRALGLQLLEDEVLGIRKVTAFCVAFAADAPKSRWRHVVPPHEGDDAGMLFDVFYLDVEQATNLLTVDRQAEFLSLIPGDWWRAAE